MLRLPINIKRSVQRRIKEMSKTEIKSKCVEKKKRPKTKRNYKKQESKKKIRIFSAPLKICFSFPT